jgi:hypothetical protein
MGCACKDRAAARAATRKAPKFAVKLPGGLKVPKTSEAAAIAFVAKHPGSKVIKDAA